jgi:manganese/zinc/iron transport system substrate-binding protein
MAMRSTTTGLFLLLLASIGCTPSESNKSPQSSLQYSGNYPIQATVTVGMIADLVRQIGGERVAVKQLLGADVDPHLYKPNRDDIQALNRADIVFYNGLMLEGKMAEVLHRHQHSVAVAEKIMPERLNPQHPGAAGEQAHPDPHVWMDVSLWSDVAQVIGDTLCTYDAPHAAEYRSRTSEVRANLDSLHAYGIQQIGCIPADQRVLVTSHDAFRYFGRAYGIEVEAIQGISTESEAGLQRVNDLVDLLVSRKIQALFVESSVPPESMKALQRGAVSRGHSVKIADELFSDAMGEAGTYEGTYIGMMDHNLTSIARALGCKSVPAGGFRSIWTPATQGGDL